MSEDGFKVVQQVGAASKWSDDSKDYFKAA